MTSPPVEAPTAGPRRILVAEDVGSSRIWLVHLLRQFTVADLHEARDGPTALEMFRSLRPALTFLDIQMPGLDGMDVLAKIRAEGETSAFVVIVSGHSEPGIVLRASKLGVGGFVVKPYSAARVMAILIRYAERTGDRAMLRDESSGS